MLRGGAVIGQGTYGCAVSPPLLCRGQTRDARLVTKGKQVGKLTLQTDAMTELHIAKILRTTSLWKHYFILPELTDCQPVAAGSSNWGSCKITKTETEKTLKQVISDFGGRSFSSLAGKNLRPGSFDYFFFFEHLLEACAYLALNGVVHYDLHRSNILIDPLGVPRLLDFGMSFSARNIDNNIIGNRWKVYDPKYDSEPPEVTIITGIREKLDISKAIENTGKLEISKMERNISILATISAVAPMFGFLGTVFGVITIFRDIAEAGSLQIGTVSEGLYLKMISSAVGLIVGMIAYVGYNTLVSRIGKVINKMEANAVEFLDILEQPSN
jgi:serine/threonine protein kinase